MNEIVLRGIIRDIEYSHSVNNVDYYQAKIICSRNDKQDIILIKFKQYVNTYKDGDFVELVGNIRSFSKQLDNGKNKVELYVFTYQDIPEDVNTINEFVLDGRICKIEELRTTKSGKHNLHFVVANNITTEKQKINNYCPSVVWGKLAREMSTLKVSDRVKLKGQLHSREYKKHLDDGSIEIRVAHELYITDYELID